MLQHRFRYISTNATATAVTGSSILAAAGCFTQTANTNVRSLYESFKINSVEMWTPPASQGSSATCSINWLGAASSPSVEISDTTVSVATPAHVRSSPPSSSLAKFWNIGGTTMFTLVAPVGTIIDVSLQLILFDETTSSGSTAVATAAVGQIYYLSLDPNATHYYTPVSLTTTF